MGLQLPTVMAISWLTLGPTKLNIGGSASLSSTVANEIEASVMAALSAGIVANYGADSSFDVQEFDVVYSGDTLQITNREGRALAVEYFSSNDGNMTVTPTNEPGEASVFSLQKMHLLLKCG